MCFNACYSTREKSTYKYYGSRLEISMGFRCQKGNIFMSQVKPKHRFLKM